ncbi:CUB and zona pellucida-like domain-containing protein 1 [Channa argus]|uniref:CUB and zona pellucida-like domain-containing protein 1 n=1 Tax=Channa argus TaxID=215402 RepID=A0A6G1P8Z2_CHAAH|nr:CUB and zona pellucida-like domain-containing protein 1 [Channa argus]KAK2919876.1 hypothetical protein Q8A73_002080 [Channa argus]
MEESLVLVLIFTLVGITSALSFYGDSVSFLPLQKNSDGTFEVSFYHRQNGRSSCQEQSSLTCESGVCTSFDQSSVLQTDQDNTGQGRWCQSEQLTTATVSTNKYLSLRNSSCCWLSNIEGTTNWTSYAELDLGIRSDSNTLNHCPVTTTVSSLRVPQNCFSSMHLLAYDPDGDEVRCSFSPNATIPANFALNEVGCTLTSTGQVSTGVHVFELILEDFPTQNITLTYTDGTSAFLEAFEFSTPLCKVKLQFAVEILPPIPSCEAGHVQPMFLSITPSHGEILHATVNQTLEINIQAQAHHSIINDFQVSGPENMTKVFTYGISGKADVTLSWTPQQSDLSRVVPLCFTAETNDTQSEMRCVAVIVNQASVSQGKVSVECLANKMSVLIDKASIPGIDVNFLQLRDPSCSLMSNETYIMGSISFSTCGTKLEDKGDFIAFINEIHSFELPSTIITRRKRIKIDFSCLFPKTISISTYYSLHNSDYIFTESNFGSFGYTFDIFVNDSFTTVVDPSAYPVQVELMQMIYMGIQAQSDLPKVTLFVDSCKATPDDNPNNPLHYDLIKNGCNQDETLTIYQPNQTTFNFGVGAFKFTGNYNEVYITCTVILCQTGDPFSRCSQGCLKNPTRRRRRAVGMETDRHDITQGPLQIVQQAVPNAAVNDNRSVMKKGDLSATVKSPPENPSPVVQVTKSSGEGWNIKEMICTNISATVFASAFLMSVVVMAVIVRYFRRQRKAEDQKALIANSGM